MLCSSKLNKNINQKHKLINFKFCLKMCTFSLHPIHKNDESYLPAIKRKEKIRNMISVNIKHNFQ